MMLLLEGRVVDKCCTTFDAVGRLKHHHDAGRRSSVVGRRSSVSVSDRSFVRLFVRSF